MDHMWLYNAPPPCTEAVAWSQDNLLAIAAGSTAAILSPGQLDGARASAAAPTLAQGAALTSTDGLCVGGVPGQPESSESLVWAVAGEIKAEEGLAVPWGVSRTRLRGLAWSPVGCSLQEGCYLSLVTTDGKVRA